ncbi:MAG: mechanosensitive ion channel family protein [Magnetococcales bacterium]|nr:mechanosensitive ion channel family protein [Magnetococcales bacterium]
MDLDNIFNYFSGFHVYFIVFSIPVLILMFINFFPFKKKNKKFQAVIGVFLAISIIDLVLWLLIPTDELDLLLDLWFIKILHTAWWLTLSMVVNQFLDFFIWRGVFVRDNGEPLIPSILTDMLSVIIYFVSFLAILHFVFQKPVTGLLATSGVMAIILGYSAQNTFGDLFAGISINLDRQFTIGDWIEFDGRLGEVVDMNWRSVILKNHDRNHVIFPNQVLTKAEVVNITRPSPVRRILLDVIVNPEATPARVEAALLKAAKESVHTVDDPPPAVWVREMVDRGMMFTLIFFTKHSSDPAAKSPVNAAIWYLFQQEKIQMFPNRQDIFLHQEVESEIVPFSNGDVEKSIRSVPLFSSLTSDDVSELARRTNQLHFGPPQRIIVRDADGASMFIIGKGEVEVLVAGAEGGDLKVAELPKGSIIGEMALLTGEKRGATIRALTDVTVFEITKDAFKSIIQKRPEAVTNISELLAKRSLETSSKMAEDQEGAASRKKQEQGLAAKFAARISAFLEA